MYHQPYIYKFSVSIFITTIVIVSCLYCLTSVSGRPDTIGIFLYCCGISFGLIDPHFNKKYISYLFCILILWLAMLTKQYYGIIILLFLINNYKNINGIIILLSSILVFFILCYYFLPVYMLSWFHHINVAGRLSYWRSISQFLELFKNLNLFVPTLCVLLYLYKMNTRKTDNVTCNNLLIFTVSIILLLFFSMGRHSGNWMTYYNELLVPCLGFIFILLSPYLSKKIIVFVMTACLITVGVPQIIDFDKNLIKRERFEVYNIQTPDKIFVCPAAFFDPELRKMYKYMDGGQMEYLDTLYSPIKFLRMLPNIQTADKKRESYTTEIKHALNNQEYDMIFFDQYCILNKPHFREILYKKYTEKKINDSTSIFITDKVKKN